MLFVKSALWFTQSTGSSHSAPIVDRTTPSLFFTRMSNSWARCLPWLKVQEPDIAQRLVGDALENLVSAFDGFGREVCAVAAPKSSDPKKACDVRFQNLIGANSSVQKLFAVDLFSFVSPDEWTFICKCFQKRHLLAHKMGVVDQDYITLTNDTSAVIGRKISIQPDEVKKLGALLAQLGRQFAARLVA